MFDGLTLDGWRTRHFSASHRWCVLESSLVNSDPGDDLVSLEHFRNFKLSLQYRLEPHADSGVHLRGRYEIQLTDRLDPAQDVGRTGAIYGFLAPTQSADSPAGQWNTLEATLIGPRVWVAINGRTLIDGREIPGITGDALDSDEGDAGPIMLQGYLGRVAFRNIEITLAR